MAEHWDSRRELLVDEADIFPMALGHLRCVFNLCLRELYIAGAIFIEGSGQCVLLAGP